jgi:hypothetical protein
MEIGLLQEKFARMGARLQFGEVRNRWRQSAGIDIRTDGKGEYFDIRLQPDEAVEYEVVDLRPEMRHLLLLARRDGGGKEKFLCGHDERHWFVCAVPGRSVSSVRAAMEALQPPAAQLSVSERLRRVKNRLRRRNEAFVRQGEWFFIPATELAVDEKLVLRNEPISRGRGGKPHMCQYLYRVGGEVVMVCQKYPTGLTMSKYEQLIKTNPKAQRYNWTRMTREARVYVRGRVWHKDHKTIVLDGWHRVVMNTENLAPGSKNVVFLD